MRRENYIKITGMIRGDEKKIRLVKTANRILTGIVFLSYPVFLLYLLWNRHPFLVRAVCVPAISFGGVTVFRKLFNAPRPYERFDIPPVLEKDTKGKSFPSRHVFSVFIIAMTVGFLFPAIGIGMGVLGAALGAIRVIGGVHDGKDVAAGAIIGMVCGIVGFYLFR